MNGGRLRQKGPLIDGQLNPKSPNYHKRLEGIDLLETDCFTYVKAHHRRGYTWYGLTHESTGVFFKSFATLA